MNAPWALWKFNRALRHVPGRGRCERSGRSGQKMSGSKPPGGGVWSGLQVEPLGSVEGYLIPGAYPRHLGPHPRAYKRLPRGSSLECSKGFPTRYRRVCLALPFCPPKGSFNIRIWGAQGREVRAPAAFWAFSGVFLVEPRFRTRHGKEGGERGWSSSAIGATMGQPGEGTLSGILAHHVSQHTQPKTHPAHMHPAQAHSDSTHIDTPIFLCFWC